MRLAFSIRPLPTLWVALGVLAFACGPMTPEDPVEEASRLSTVRQATYGGDIGNALGTPVVSGSTVGKTNEFTPPCSYSSAPEVSYTWTPPATGSYTITTAGSSFDTILVVRTYEGSTVLGCNDDAPSTLQSSLTLSLSGGVAYIITVDGYGSNAGSFKLNIAGPGGCTPNIACNSPPGQCYEAAGTCDPATGQCNYAPKAANTACNDGNACTLNDVCNGTGGCGGTAVTCNSPPGQCYVSTGTCNPSSGLCSYEPRSAGSSCSDGKACTVNDTCDGYGSCSSGDTSCPRKTCYLPGECGETGNCEYLHCTDVGMICSSGTCKYVGGG